MVDASTAPPKVVSLYGGAIRQHGEVSPAVVAEAERVLEMAKAGEIVGIAAVFVHHDECTSSSIHGLCGRMALGQLAIVQHDLCQRLVKE